MERKGRPTRPPFLLLTVPTCLPQMQEAPVGCSGPKTKARPGVRSSSQTAFPIMCAKDLVTASQTALHHPDVPSGPGPSPGSRRQTPSSSQGPEITSENPLPPPSLLLF